MIKVERLCKGKESVVRRKGEGRDWEKMFRNGRRDRGVIWKI